MERKGSSRLVRTLDSEKPDLTDHTPYTSRDSVSDSHPTRLEDIRSASTSEWGPSYTVDTGIVHRLPPLRPVPPTFPYDLSLLGSGPEQ